VEFNISEAALSGLNLFRRKPVVYGWWLVFNLLFIAAALGLIYLLFAGWVQQLVSIATTKGEPTPAMVLSIFPRIGLAILVLLPAGLVFNAIRQGAATRAILNPDDDRFGYLRLGGDEMRLVLVNLVLFLIRLAIGMVFGIILGIVMMGAGLSMARNGGDNVSALIAAQVIRQILTLPLYAVTAFLFVKFSFAYPMTVEMKKVEIFGSWTMTNHRFWPMLMSFALAFLIWIGFAIVAGIVGFLAMLGAGGAVIATLGSTLQSNPQEAVRQILTFMPALIAAIAVLSALFTPVATALFYCPGPTIYKAITGRTEDVF
jgi:hypothetical protein